MLARFCITNMVCFKAWARDTPTLFMTFFFIYILFIPVRFTISIRILTICYVSVVKYLWDHAELEFEPNNAENGTIRIIDGVPIPTGQNTGQLTTSICGRERPLSVYPNIRAFDLLWARNEPLWKHRDCWWTPNRRSIVEGCC